MPIQFYLPVNARVILSHPQLVNTVLVGILFFVPHEYTQPFSQLSMATKNLVSHRGRAVRQWADWLGQNQDVLLERQRQRHPSDGSGSSNSSSSTTRTYLGHQGLTFSLRPNGIQNVSSTN
jgi:hypothetical protein